MLRIVLIAALLVAAMVAVKREHALERAGLVGTCRVVAMPGDPGEWRACRPGAVTGYTDLSLKECKPRGSRGEVRYWRCEAPLGSGVAAG